ncbi:cytochrome c oxidase subunit II [Pelagibacteraceae bacterium]|nr:cytochrome c oxidase subunit II [Pelagibacteraceae bacterium]
MKIIPLLISVFISLPVLSNGATDWQLGFQKPASDHMQNIFDLHNFVLIMMTAITIFVLILLIYVAIRFRKSANPNPSKRTHNALLETLWTAIPVIILIFMAVPSFKLLYEQDVIPEAEMTIKVIGHQWYWEYQYPEHGDLSFESYLVPEDELKDGDPRLLTVDNRLVLPVNKNIHVLITAGDVLHSFAMPSLGVKRDAVPGRLNETWMRIDRPGIYRGQCSEICGTGHGYMPVVIEALSENDFAAWVNEAKNEFAELNSRTIASK